jgi:hypothetical protein
MLKLVYYGQNDGLFGPDVNLTGDPGTDNTTLLNAGFLGGKIMALKTSTVTARGTVLVPCDAATLSPYGFLLNGPGEFSSAITPSGSGKMSVVRAFAGFLVDAQAYVAAPTKPYAVGQPVYCGTGANAGLLTADAPTAGQITAGAYAEPVGTITVIPTASFPWLGVSSKL